MNEDIHKRRMRVLQPADASRTTSSAPACSTSQTAMPSMATCKGSLAPSRSSALRSLEREQQRPIQTLARAYAALCSGTPPWVALNEFFHEWFDYSRERRELLVADPIPYTKPPIPSALRSEQQMSDLTAGCKEDGILAPAINVVSTPQLQAVHVKSAHDTCDDQRTKCDMDGLDRWRWAVFCAGAADHLCQRFGVSRPGWIDDPAFVLAEPWYGFGDPNMALADAHAYLERVPPKTLRRRNVFGGNKMFSNKHELAALRRGY